MMLCMSYGIQKVNSLLLRRDLINAHVCQLPAHLFGSKLMCYARLICNKWLNDLSTNYWAERKLSRNWPKQELVWTEQKLSWAEQIELSVSGADRFELSVTMNWAELHWTEHEQTRQSWAERDHLFLELSQVCLGASDLAPPGTKTGRTSTWLHEGD